MAIVTINADVSNTFSTITLSSKATTQQAKVQGTLTSPIVGRDNVIADYEAQGYKFVGELDCTLHFQMEETSCSYDSKSQEINSYLNQGYEIVGEVDCQVTLEKAGVAPVIISLDVTTEIVEEISVNGSYTGDVSDEVIIEGQLITVEDEQLLIDEGYTYEGVKDGKRTWSREISYFDYDNRLQTIAEYERKGYTFLGEVDGTLKFSGTFEKCEIKDKIKIITEQKEQGFELISEGDCVLHFQRSINSISNETDVYAFFDTTSMQLQDGQDASKALKGWFSQYQSAHPDYKGNMYIIPVYYERYLDYLDIVKKGNAVGKDLGGNTSDRNAAYTTKDWRNIAIYPPNFDYATTNRVNANWTPPSDVLMLAFVDEANGGGYHTGHINLDGQPTEYYTEDYNRFLTNLDSFNFFKSVLYPIVQLNKGECKAFLLQAMAAIEGKIMTDTEIANTGTTIDVSILKTHNPYTTYKPLKELGWIGVYDKVSPASGVFNGTQFSSELNEVIQSGGSSELQKEDKYIEGSKVNYTKEEVVEGFTKVKKEYIYQEGCEIKIGDPEYFKDASFTVAYSPLMGAWISYYSFVPNYYVNHNEYFQTGLNKGVGGLWDHLKTNKDYQSFYGELHPWILEIPIREQMISRTLKDIEYYLDAKEYSEDYDYALVRNRGFNKAWVYNNRVNTGELNLRPSNGLMSDLSKYPNTLSQTQQEIPYSDFRGKHRFNYFHDRVIDDNSNIPVWKWDINQIHKELNPEAISFTGKSTLDQIKGDWFSIRFQQDERTDTRYEFKWLVTSETIKP